MRWHGAAVAVAVGLGLAAAAEAAEGRARYEVQPGDTLWALAKQRGCTVEELHAANEGLHAGLRVGQTLHLPRCDGAGSAATYVVRRGDTLGHIAARHGVSVTALLELNRLESSVIFVGQRLSVPSAEPAVRLVLGQSLGRPHRGRLQAAVRLPHDPGYYRRNLGRAYAAAHVVDHLRAALDRVQQLHPRVHRLAIGDLSDPDGGPISGHASHQSGRDVDLGLYFEGTPPAPYPREFVPVSRGTLDVAATWTLVEALYQASDRPGGPLQVFLDYEIQGELYEHARRRGVRKAALAEIFQYPDGPFARGRFVQHVKKHDDHLHVRFRCPPDDATCIE